MKSLHHPASVSTAKKILAALEEMQAEADQLSQVEQDPRAGEEFMVERIATFIDIMLEFM